MTTTPRRSRANPRPNPKGDGKPPKPDVKPPKGEAKPDAKGGEAKPDGKLDAKTGANHKPKSPVRAPLVLGGVEIRPGETKTVQLSAPRQLAHDSISMTVHVVHGKLEGPCLFVSAGIHGDEINGVEIVRRLLERRALKELRGTLLAVPVVNVHGFMNGKRYLPDRRDLNRSFPGLEKGSLAARLAHLFATEIVARSTHGIDLHTGSFGRSNLPQIRGDLDNEEVLYLAKRFRVPVVLHASGPNGTMHEVTRPRGIPLLVFEGGEALRMDEGAIKAGLRGVLEVLRTLEMLPPRKTPPAEFEPVVARARKWVRAPESGLFLTPIQLGDTVHEGDPLGRIVDPFSGDEEPVAAPATGVVVGLLKRPLVNEGDALLHLALSKKPERAAEVVDAFGELLASDVSYDDAVTEAGSESE